jgi:hypothetical protein
MKRYNVSLGPAARVSMFVSELSGQCFRSAEAAARYWRGQYNSKRHPELWIVESGTCDWREVDAAGNLRPSRETMAADLEELAKAL